MERHAEESKDKLKSAQREFAELKAQAQEFNADDLEYERYAVRPQIETDTAEDLQKIYGKAFSKDIFVSAKEETDKANGETGKRSIRRKLERNKSKIQTEIKPQKKKDKDFER